ncbi:unnamed protein product [Durusdinium trenchii]|uniref:Uncharacterized protein n=1 Tax=Durusdinium trenchii TaxID=1381693 RepID=A0ABP0SAQ7_9DINO
MMHKVKEVDDFAEKKAKLGKKAKLPSPPGLAQQNQEEEKGKGKGKYRIVPSQACHFLEVEEYRLDVAYAAALPGPETCPPEIVLFEKLGKKQWQIVHQIEGCLKVKVHALEREKWRLLEKLDASGRLGVVNPRDAGARGVRQLSERALTALRRVSRPRPVTQLDEVTLVEPSTELLGLKIWERFRQWSQVSTSLASASHPSLASLETFCMADLGQATDAANQFFRRQVHKKHEKQK